MAEQTENRIVPTKPLLSGIGLSTEQRTWIIDRMALAELSKGLQSLSDKGAQFNILLWGKTVLEIGEQRFEAAFLRALESSPHRPDISEIRRHAGLDAESEAHAALRELIAIQRLYGRKAKGQFAEKLPVELRNGAKGDEIVKAPTLNARTEAALLDLGMGDRLAGLNAAWEHRALDSVRSGDELSQLSWPRQYASDRIEKAWAEAWARSAAK